MPGVAACGRCGSRLDLERAAIEVHPPRATARQKQLRRLFRLGPASARIRDAARAAFDGTRGLLDRSEVTFPPAAVLLRCIVPGWAQFYLGDVLLARCLVGAYVPLVFLGLVLFGSYPGAILVGIAVSIHASSVVAMLLRYGTSQPARMLVAMLVLVVLAVGVYGPALWAMTRVALPITVQDAAAPLAEGDIVLVNQLTYSMRRPALGDVVLFRTLEFSIPASPGVNQMQYRGGDQIDRILAGPEATVEWRNGELRIGGEESTVRPLNPARMPTAFSLRVPAGCYLIFPSTQPNVNMVQRPDFWKRIALVDADSIQGTAYWRSQPLLRIGRLP